MLPDDYLRKMKQDLSEVEAQVEAEVESETHYESDLDFSPAPEDDPRRFDIPVRLGGQSNRTCLRQSTMNREPIAAEPFRTRLRLMNRERGSSVSINGSVLDIVVILG